ncbi:hypothetical protein [Caldimonas mangrovi]|uniref:hypothetical protein n=1 Tax=Caldimonas mangrovi TaxID=2944811 RepID=UPI0020449268|nr:hypothetical protein [Caldimonas mangrovi]
MATLRVERKRNPQGVEPPPPARWKVIAGALLFTALTVGVSGWVVVAGSDLWRALLTKPPSITYNYEFTILLGCAIGMIGMTIFILQGVATPNGSPTNGLIKVLKVSIWGFIVLFFGTPIAICLMDVHLKAAGYEPCEEASYSGFRSLAVVYVQPQPGLCEQLAARRKQRSASP